MIVLLNEKNKYGVIYKITNTLNCRSYIGQTIVNNPFKRINCHFKKQKSVDLVYRSFIKNHKNKLLYSTEILYISFSKEDLDFKEKYFINFFNTVAPNGYNIQLGGNNGLKFSEETKAKISKANKGHSRGKGICKSVDHIKAMSDSRKGFTSINRIIVNREVIKRKMIPIVAKNLKTGVEISFKSIADCSNQLGLISTNISATLKNQNGRTQHKGYTFVKQKA